MKEDSQDYNATSEALNYGTMWTNSLFERDGSVLKISRAGGAFTLRILWSSIIWGGALGILGLGISVLIFQVIFGMGTMGIPLIFGGTVAPLIIGIRLGRWSPIEKETGEDLITYIKMKLRQKIAIGGLTKSPSTTNLYSKAVGGEKGRIVRCQQWLGTQPLVNAPPMDPYEWEYKTDYVLYPRGEYRVVPSELYSDGLPDRF